MATELIVTTASGQVWDKRRVDARLQGTRAVDTAFQERALVLLAGVCDGAFARDGQGFNGRDAAFAKDLAEQIAGIGVWTDRSGVSHRRTAPRSLTVNQLAAARRLLVKYAGQILKLMAAQPGARSRQGVAVAPPAPVPAYDVDAPCAPVELVVEAAPPAAPGTSAEAWAILCAGPSAAERAAALSGAKARVDASMRHYAALTEPTVKGGRVLCG